MTKKELLKKMLLDTGYFIDNQYLDNYLNLVLLNDYTGTAYSEIHHILQRAYFKKLGLLVDQTKTNKVRLLYKDHCYAHYLLYFCTTGFLKQANFTALKTLWANSNAFSVKAKTLKEVSPADFECLQTYMQEVAEDPDNCWWSQKELDVLCEYYPKEGGKVAARLPNRALSSCLSKANHLGLYHNTTWTEEELKILQNHYPTEGPINTQALLPNRTIEAVRRMAANLGIKNIARYWSEAELDILRQYYPIEDTKAFNRLPNRARGDCLKKAHELGLYSKNYWSPEEIEILIQYYPSEGAAVCNRISKDAAACRNKASRMGLKAIRGRKRN